MDEETQMKIENKEKALSNALKEEGMIQKGIDDLNSTIPMYEEEYQINMDNFDVIHDNFQILKPNWAYEQDLRYIDNLRKLNMITKKKITIQKEQKMREFEDTLRRLNEQKSQIQPYIVTLQKEIDALKEE